MTQWLDVAWHRFLRCQAFLHHWEVRNLIENGYFGMRSHSPFDDSAPERLRRMGLLNADGKPDRNALETAAHIYAGALYDALCDYHNDMDQVNRACQNLIEHSGSEDPKAAFLAICSAYDAIYLDLPEPVWWTAGNLEVVTLFSKQFASCLKKIMLESGVV